MRPRTHLVADIPPDRSAATTAARRRRPRGATAAGARGRERARRLPAALVAALALVLLGCGDDDVGGPQVTPGVTGFVGADLDDVPVPPLATPLGPASEVDEGVVVRSYAVRDRTVGEVMAFYADALADRPVASPVRQLPGSADARQGTWIFDDGVLTVTAQRAPTVDEGDGPSGGGLTTQLSLQLEPG
ncbi:MAG: hypothetical protein AB7H43_12235 [Acidimicrobiia bacterium]